MHFFKPALVAAALFVSANPAMAQAQNAQAAGSRFACDTPGGRVSSFTIPVTANAITISGTLRPASFRAHETYLPTATLALTNAAGNSALSMQLVAANSQAPGANLSVRQVLAGDDKTSPVGTLALGSEVDFEVTYNRAGQNSFTIGERSFTGTGDFGSSLRLTVSCSSGDFIFKALKLDVKG